MRLLALLGVVLVAGGLLVIARADDGLVRERADVQGTPVSVVRPPGDGPFPGVVVAHGFNASSRLMDGIGIALARDGWVAAMLDFPGHGANLQPLGADPMLEQDVADVAGWLADRPDVDGPPTLLGHSMGAGAVTRAATDDPGVPATVALSLPSADDLPAADEGPARLLLLVGSGETGGFVDAVGEASDLGYVTGVVAGAQHISILFSTQTLAEATSWLDAAVGRSPTPVAPDWRMPAVAAVYLGTALLFWPLSGWVVRSRAEVVRGRGPRLPGAVGVVLAAVGAAAMLALVPGLGEVVPLLIGGYLAAFVALAGGLLWLQSRRGERPVGSAVVAGVVLGGYAALAIAVPAQLTWAQVSLAGVRGWSLLLLTVASLVYGWGELLLWWRPGRAVGYGRVIVGRLLLAGVLAGAAALGAAPGFLMLLVPLMLVVLPWLGALAVRTARRSGSPLAGALVQGLPLAVLLSATTPVA